MGDEQTTVRAVRTADVPVFLSLVPGAELRCAVCGTLVTEETIGGLVKVRGAVRVFCERPDCLSAARVLHTDRPGPEAE